jgi:integration host factor subunit beta|tara:strand:- start:519 stop:800 length:282 start_codon:yes stop_codon:yes gene_type:complete
LSRSEIIKKLRKKNPELNTSELEIVVDTFSESIGDALRENKKVILKGFGTFFVKKLNERRSARNPKTGEIIYVPEKNRVRFKTSKKLKKFINE